jgi:hypothetical protein
MTDAAPPLRDAYQPPATTATPATTAISATAPR